MVIAHAYAIIPPAQRLLYSGPREKKICLYTPLQGGRAFNQTVSSQERKTHII